MLERIHAALPALPPAEQRVAKLLLSDPRSFATLPVAELAERSHVSKPTVVRFCRSVGYDGLADFKRKLAGSVNEGVPFVHRAVDEDDKTSDIVVNGLLVGKTAAVINRLEDGWYLSCVGGLARVKINGQAVKASIKLNRLDVITLGKLKMQFLQTP